METAAEAYFGVSASELTLEQAAVLAAIINAPGNYNPDTNMENLENRYAYVINAMYEEGYITEAERDEALDNFPEIKKRKVSEKYKGPTGYLIRAVQEELLALGFTEAEIEGGGLRIVSTFDKKAQASAVKAVKDEAPTTGMEGVRIGLAAVEPGTGEFIAMYGGADYLEDQFNNATMASQQAGSTFKPFGLAAATEDEIGLDTLWPGNSPTEIAGYEVNNYGDNSYGEQVTLLKGTEQSINTVYVSVENETGVQPVQDAALRAGIPEDTKGLGLEDPNLTFVLGTASPHTVDVAQSYATFAARGERAATTTILSVSATDGSVLYERTEEPRAGVRREHRGCRQLRPPECREQRHGWTRPGPGPAGGGQDRVDRRVPVGMVRRVRPAAGVRRQLQQERQERQRPVPVGRGWAGPVLRQWLSGTRVDGLHDRRPGRYPGRGVRGPGGSALGRRWVQPDADPDADPDAHPDADPDADAHPDPDAHPDADAGAPDAGADPGAPDA